MSSEFQRMSDILKKLSDPNYVARAEKRLFESGETVFHSLDDILFEDVLDIPFQRKRLWVHTQFGKIKKPVTEVWLDPDNPDKKAELPKVLKSKFFSVNTYNIDKRSSEELLGFFKQKPLMSIDKMDIVLKRLKEFTGEPFAVALTSNCRIIFFSTRVGRKRMIELRYSKRLFDYAKAHGFEHNEDDEAEVPAALRQKIPQDSQEAAEKYKDSDRATIKAKEELVRNSVSLSYEPFKREALNREKLLKDTGEKNMTVVNDAISFSDSLYESSSKSEPDITKDMVAVARSSGATMYGLGFRMKQPTSLSSKLISDRQADMVKGYKTTIKEKAGQIYDAVRYTMVFPFERLASGYKMAVKKLRGLGYTEMRCKNFYSRYRKGEASQKAVQSVFRSPDGTYFELQFHTIVTLGVKEATHTLYEEWRVHTVSTERKKLLEMRMNNLSATLKDPPGIFAIREFDTIKSSGDSKREPKTPEEADRQGLQKSVKDDTIHSEERSGRL